MISSPVASTSAPVIKAPKNPGLALVIERETNLSPKFVANRPSPYSVGSTSNTPELEPDWMAGDDTPDCDDECVQYVYIAADSPYYRAPASPRTSAYLSFTGFPFACDALTEEDPLFACSTEPLFVDELDDCVFVVDPAETQDIDLRPDFERNLKKTQQAQQSAKSTEGAIRTDDDLFHFKA